MYDTGEPFTALRPICGASPPMQKIRHPYSIKYNRNTQKNGIYTTVFDLFCEKTLQPPGSFTPPKGYDLAHGRMPYASQTHAYTKYGSTARANKYMQIEVHLMFTFKCGLGWKGKGRWNWSGSEEWKASIGRGRILCRKEQVDTFCCSRCFCSSFSRTADASTFEKIIILSYFIRIAQPHSVYKCFKYACQKKCLLKLNECPAYACICTF